MDTTHVDSNNSLVTLFEPGEAQGLGSGSDFMPPHRDRAISDYVTSNDESATQSVPKMHCQDVTGPGI
jgi:hypothetical protein